MSACNYESVVATQRLCYVLVMAEAPTDVVLQILIKIQDSIVAQATRLERIENLVRKQRREGAGMLVMMRATVSDFDERVGDVEERLAVLEARQS